IFSRKNSAAVSLARWSIKRSLNEKPKPSPAAVPARLVLAPPFVLRQFQRRAVVDRHDKADPRGPRPLAELGIFGLDPPLVVRVERPVVRRDAEIRRPLEHGQPRGLLGDDRDRLDRRRAGADDADPESGEIEAFK